MAAADTAAVWVEWAVWIFNPQYLFRSLSHWERVGERVRIRSMLQNKNPAPAGFFVEFFGGLTWFNQLDKVRLSTP